MPAVLVIGQRNQAGTWLEAPYYLAFTVLEGTVQATILFSCELYRQQYQAAQPDEPTAIIVANLLWW